VAPRPRSPGWDSKGLQVFDTHQRRRSREGGN
jgi:hypothetical protein